MDRVAIKTHAKKQIKGKIFTLLAIYIIVALALGVVGLVPMVGSVAAIVVSGPIAYAFSKIYLDITKKGTEPKIEDVLSGFKDDNFSRTFIAYLRYEVFVFLWSLLFIVPGIIKSIAYSQMYFLMAEDSKMDAATAQKKSMEIMEGHKCEYFVLQLSFIPWYLLVCITLGIASIYVTPYVSAANAEFYNKLKK